MQTEEKITQVENNNFSFGDSIYEFQNGEKCFSLWSSKLDALMKDLEATRKTNKTTKSIIFSQFTTFLDLIEFLLQRAKFKFVRLDGRYFLEDLKKKRNEI